MALCKCPECGKTISSEATICPHCGFPLKNTSTHEEPSSKCAEEDETITSNNISNSGKTKVKKSVIFVIIVIVTIFIGFFATPKIISAYNEAQQESKYSEAKELEAAQKYEEAIDLYKQLGTYKDSQNQLKSITYKQAGAYFDSNQFSQAADLFKTLGTYKDSEKKLKISQSCQTEKGLFLYNLRKSLSARWAIKVADEDDVTMCKSEELYDRVDAELKMLEPYAHSVTFENKEFGDNVRGYMNSLSESRKAIASIKNDDGEKWDDCYYERLKYIAYFYDNGLTMESKKDQERLNDLYSKYQDYKITEEIGDNLTLVDMQYNYASNCIIIELANDSNYTLSYIHLRVGLYKVDNPDTTKTPDPEQRKFIETCYTNELVGVKPKEKMIFVAYPSYSTNDWNYYEWISVPGEDFSY